MGLIGVLSSDESLNKSIEAAFSGSEESQFHLHVVSKTNEVLDFLNFDLPEIVVANFSDQEINMQEIVDQIREDTWLHNFAIIGVYDRNKEKEDNFRSMVKDINVLNMMSFSMVKSHLVRSIKIIDRNKQIIFQKEISNRLFDTASGSFSIPNDPFAASLYAGLAVSTIYQRGLISPENKVNLQISLTELILNGIEHGNCRISYDEKSKHLMEGGGIHELIYQRCEDPAIDKKRVFLEWDISQESTKFLIRDEGDGFDVQSLQQKIKDYQKGVLNGRGILMTVKLAKRLYYNKKGNEVTLEFAHENDIDKQTPMGFSHDEIILIRKGDVVFQEGETSDFLYYIASGTFSVYHQSKKVGVLTPSDIFMGEMSFLLNNKRSATVRADKDGKIVRISRKSFISVVKQFPHYGIFLSKLLAAKLVRSNEQTVQLSMIASQNA